MSLIKVNNLKIGYLNHIVLSGISFEVNEGDYLCIVGENGSGKTTLIKGILGLIPKFQGSIEFHEVMSKNQIGYLSQQLKLSGEFPASVKEIVMSGFLNKKRFGLGFTTAQREEADRIAELVGIKDIFKSNFCHLSGGQQQRVLLARALCAANKLILLDEPTSALDPIATAEFYALLKKINSQGVTVIMVSHDVNAAVRNASHILCLDGENSFFGTTHQYVHSELGSKMLLSDCPCDDCKHFSRKEGSADA
ncbi:MAG: ABC transporter ATP-binding protein [Ruminococcaceae bacterium]|nr:ABC transporter ATP-binding protein [Oscillospiraceae bacterium]